MKSSTIQGTIHFTRMQNMKCQSLVLSIQVVLVWWVKAKCLGEREEFQSPNHVVLSAHAFSNRKFREQSPGFWHAKWAAESTKESGLLRSQHSLLAPSATSRCFSIYISLMFTFQLCTDSRPALMIQVLILILNSYKQMFSTGWRLHQAAMKH